MGDKKMIGKQALSSSEIFSEEEETLKTVYSFFDKTIADQTADYNAAKAYALSGNYEAQDTFMHYGAASSKEKKKFETVRLISSIKNSPYFAHILIKDENEGALTHCLMSDCETLDHTINIKGTEETMIIPFKQDTGREIFNQLFHLYQEKTGSKFTADKYTYEPIFIRSDDIFEQQLQNATQFFPVVELKDEEIIDCDEFLNRKLRENRRNTSLSNIIATLQRKQYDIIKTDTYFIDDTVASDYYVISAVLRNFFLDHNRYDYNMQSLFDAVKESSVSPLIFYHLRCVSSLVYGHSIAHGLSHECHTGRKIFMRFTEE